MVKRFLLVLVFPAYFALAEVTSVGSGTDSLQYHLDSNRNGLTREFLDVANLREVTFGRIVKNPVVQRIPFHFEFCESFETSYQAYKILRKKLDGSTYEDIEITFNPMTKEQFEHLRTKYSKNRSQIIYRPGSRYSITDFLPPQYQASHAVESSGGNTISANCWGTAYEMRNPSDTFFYSSVFDPFGTTQGNTLFEEIVTTGKHLGNNPIGNRLQTGDLQFFHDPIVINNGIIGKGEFSHARSFAACEKNGNHLMFEMPSMSAEPRRFVSSTEEWHGTGNFPHWYRIKRTDPNWYPERGTANYDHSIYALIYDSEGRAGLKPKLKNIAEVISSNMGGNILMVTTQLPTDIDTVDRKRAVWELVKRDFTKNRDLLTSEYLGDINTIKQWLISDMEFFSTTVQLDPLYHEINGKLREGGYESAF